MYTSIFREEIIIIIIIIVIIMIIVRPYWAQSSIGPMRPNKEDSLYERPDC